MLGLVSPKTGTAATKSPETGSQWAWALSASAGHLASLISTVVLALPSCEMGGGCAAVKTPLDMRLFFF